jgi:hypothetical protein
VTKCFDDIKTSLALGGLGEQAGFTLLKYGSVVSGLAIEGSSDLDLTLVTRQETKDHQELLFKVMALLRARYGPDRFKF